MKAVKLFEPGNLKLVQTDIEKPGPNEILIRVDAAGVCGTDRHLYKGEFPSSPGQTLGHEFCGVVIERGAEVAIPVGTRISCDPNIWCGECEHCRRGRVNLCSKNIAIGIQRNGGFAEYATFPAHKAHILPDTLDPFHGSLCEPLACTLHGTDIANIGQGERVIIIGGGVIGLMALQLAVLAGAEVMMLTRSASKQKLARELGAHSTASDESEARKIWATGGDVVLECAGTPETVEMSPRLARTGGRVVILGVLAKGAKTAIDPFDLLTREVQIHFAFINPFTQERATKLISDGRIKIAPLITRTATLEEAVEIIANPPAAGEVRCLILPH